jgi:hypothetical protein
MPYAENSSPDLSEECPLISRIIFKFVLKLFTDETLALKEELSEDLNRTSVIVPTTVEGSSAWRSTKAYLSANLSADTTISKDIKLKTITAEILFVCTLLFLNKQISKTKHIKSESANVAIMSDLKVLFVFNAVRVKATAVKHIRHSGLLLNSSTR